MNAPVSIKQLAEPPPECVPRKCPACSADTPRRTGIGRAPWYIAQCDACQFVYLDALPAQEAFEGEYAWDATFLAEKKRRKQAQPIVQWLDDKTRWRLHIFPRPETRYFLERLARPGPVLDVGCADGGHAMRLPEGYRPYGVEIAQGWQRRRTPHFARGVGIVFKGMPPEPFHSLKIASSMAS